MSEVHVGYIVSQFPRYDETFIAREMDAVYRLPTEITIFSIKPCHDKIVHREAEALVHRLYYVPLVFSVSVWMSFFKILFTRPIRFIKAVFELITNNFLSPDFLIKGILMIPQSCEYAFEAERRGITHLHSHWATHPTTMALIINRLTDIPFSMTGHAHDIHVNTTGLAHKMRRAEFVLTCTGANKGYLMNIAPDLNEEKIIVSYHGLDLKTKYISAEKSSTPPFKIVSVGSCLPCKGYDRLLGACKILHDKKIDFRLTIVGGGPLESELRQHAIVLNIDEFVEFAGFVKQEDMPAYYQNADCFVLAAVPEIHWGIPNVLVEAMACCLPVIMTELPAIPEVIKDNDAGFLLDNPMPDNLAPLLERLAESEELRSRMGEIGRKRVSEMFDIDKNASEVASHFHGKKTDE